MRLAGTTPLAGLDDESMETFFEQLRFDRQFGTLLQSDVWSQDAERGVTRP